MKNVSRTYIGLSTEDGYLMLHGGGLIDSLELLSRAELAQAIGVAFTIKFKGKVFAEWIDNKIEIYGPSLPAKFGVSKTWTMIDNLTQDKAINSLKEIASNDDSRSEIMHVLREGLGEDTLFEDQDGEVSTIRYFVDSCCEGVYREEDNRYFIDIFRVKQSGSLELVSVREFCTEEVAKNLVNLFDIEHKSQHQKISFN